MSKEFDAIKRQINERGPDPYCGFEEVLCELLAEAQKDAALLDWAEKNPEKALVYIKGDWNMAGAGFREEFFNFRRSIKEAMNA